MEPATAVDAKDALFALLHPVFRDCVDPDNRRFDLSTPFVVGGFVYATDGRIIARSPATPAVVEAAALVPTRDGSRRLASPQDALPSLDRFDPEPFPLPALPAGPCGECKGSGVVPARKCLDCDGTGVEECDCCGHDTDCTECGGKGTFPGGVCGDCHGRGAGGGWLKGEPVAPGVEVAHHVLFLLHKHGATAYLAKSPDRKSAVRFTLPGVEGAFMPMWAD